MKVHGITIDDARSTDLDDAVWAEPDGNGHKVWVSIALASGAVSLGTPIDEAARARVVTRYYPGGHSSMLPRGVEERLSILPGLDRRVIVVELSLNAAHEVVDASLAVGSIRSKAKVAHGEVPTILATPGHVLHEQMKLLMAVSTAMLGQRRARGALVLYDLTHGWVTTEEGHVKRLARAQDAAGHIIVQELMIAANQAVAAYALKHGIPILYRNHQAVGAGPDRASLVTLLGSATGGDPVDWLDDVRRQTGRLVHRAEYGVEMAGHFGLNLPGYMHFTSPIRRYADLVSQRQIVAHLEGQPLPHQTEEVAAIAAHINSTLAIQRQEEEARGKEQATAAAQHAMDTRRVDALAGKDFERVVKVAVRSGGPCPDAFGEVFARRLDDGRASILSMTLVLLGTTDEEGWAELRQKVIDRLRKDPHTAISILTTATQVIDGFEGSTFATVRTGPPHAPTFTATWSARRGGEVVSASGEGSSAKMAQQRGAAGILAVLAGCSPPVFPRRAAQPAPAAETSVAAPQPDHGGGKDPIARIHEVAQAAKTPCPSFGFQARGESHAPTITCTCWYVGRETKGVAGNKQDAKRAAASAMLELLGRA